MSGRRGMVNSWASWPHSPLPLPPLLLGQSADAFQKGHTHADFQFSKTRQLMLLSTELPNVQWVSSSAELLKCSVIFKLSRVTKMFSEFRVSRVTKMFSGSRVQLWRTGDIIGLQSRPEISGERGRNSPWLIYLVHVFVLIRSGGEPEHPVHIFCERTPIS